MNKNKNKYYKLKNIYDELNRGENLIKEKLYSNKNSYNDGYEIYGVLDKNFVQRYKEYLTDYLNDKLKQEFYFNANELIPESEEKIFCMFTGNDDNKYYFPKKFILVTSNFISMIAQYFNHKDVNNFYGRFYEIFIGGKCIIRKDKKNDLEHYITLLYNQNDDNYVDFILSFISKENMKEHLDFILKNDFFYYVELIKYSILILY